MVIVSSIQLMLRLLRGCIAVITDWENSWIMSLKSPKWHDIYANFHDDRFRHSSNVKIIAWAIWESTALVLLMGRRFVVMITPGGMVHITNLWSMPLRWPQSDIYTKIYEDLWSGRGIHIQWHTHTHRQQGDFLSLHLSLQNEGIGLKMHFNKKYNIV
jgi:hypothetical protein